jgi:hypothetical protein
MFACITRWLPWIAVPVSLASKRMVADHHDEPWEQGSLWQRKATTHYTYGIMDCPEFARTPAVDQPHLQELSLGRRGHTESLPAFGGGLARLLWPFVEKWYLSCLVWCHPERKPNALWHIDRTFFFAYDVPIQAPKLPLYDSSKSSVFIPRLCATVDGGGVWIWNSRRMKDPGLSLGGRDIESTMHSLLLHALPWSSFGAAQINSHDSSAIKTHYHPL